MFKIYLQLTYVKHCMVKIGTSFHEINADGELIILDIQVYFLIIIHILGYICNISFFHLCK